jgi:hypothetical protein
MRHRSRTNSRKYEDRELRETYRESWPWCEFPRGICCRGTHDGAHIHHIAHSSRRWDLRSNLIHLCVDAHNWCHKHPQDGALICLRVKVRKDEMDLEEFFTAAGMRLAGYVAKCNPSHGAAVAAREFLAEWSE